MDFNFGFFEDMDSYFARQELNSYHDFLDSIPVVVSVDEINQMLNELADENMIVMAEEEILY